MFKKILFLFILSVFFTGCYTTMTHVRVNDVYRTYDNEVDIYFSNWYWNNSYIYISDYDYWYWHRHHYRWNIWNHPSYHHYWYWQHKPIKRVNPRPFYKKHVTPVRRHHNDWKDKSNSPKKDIRHRKPVIRNKRYVPTKSRRDGVQVKPKKRVHRTTTFKKQGQKSRKNNHVTKSRSTIKVKKSTERSNTNRKKPKKSIKSRR